MPDPYVKSPALHSALREMRQMAGDPRNWVALALLSLVVGLIGPFSTYSYMAPLPRLAYWTAVVIGTSATGTLVAGFVEALLKPRLPVWLAAALAGAAAGPVIALLVLLINIGSFGTGVTPIDVLTLAVYCTLISSAVTILSAVFAPRAKAGVSVPAVDQPALLDRLPRHMRGALLHIAVSDHYVDVTTDKGTALVLMRLSDAIRETGPTQGLQVHRSHWVALDAVRRGLRQKGKPVLELRDGKLVPVSRTYLDAVRQAGLLD